MGTFIPSTADTLPSGFVYPWRRRVVAVFPFVVLYALSPSNWKKFFPATRPTSTDQGSKQ